MKVGIIGCGGIGSNVAVNLVRAGIKDFVIADFDVIDSSNLNRQFYFEDQIGNIKVSTLEENLKKIHQNINIEAHNVTVTKENCTEIFSDCDIIVEAVDDKYYKTIVMQECSKKKLLVMASGIGNLDLKSVSTKVVNNNIFVVGDFKSDIESNLTYSTKVNYIACIMANIVLKEGFGYER